MKKELGLVLCMAILLLAGGQGRQATFSDVQVELINTGQLPKELAGHWVDKEYGFEFWLDENGQILGLVHTMARDRVIPGRTNTYNLVDDGVGRNDPGVGPRRPPQSGTRRRKLAVPRRLPDAPRPSPRGPRHRLADHPRHGKVPGRPSRAGPDPRCDCGSRHPAAATPLMTPTAQRQATSCC